MLRAGDRSSAPTTAALDVRLTSWMDRDSDKRTTASRGRTRGIRGGGSSRRPVALRLGIREGAADRLGDSFKALAIAAIRDHLDKVENRDPELVEPFNYGEEPEEPGV